MYRDRCRLPNRPPGTTCTWSDRTCCTARLATRHRLSGTAVPARAVEAEAARLSAWVGEVRVTPRFRTPLEKELSAG